MRLLTPEQFKELDRRTLARGLVSEFELILHAGRAIADWISGAFAKNQKILILCGPGHNGADGYIAARALADKGYGVEIFQWAEPVDTETARAAKMAAERSILFHRQEPSLDSFQILVDALFGVGLSRDLDPSRFSDMFHRISQRKNEKKLTVLAVDLPSGLDGRTGQIRGCVLKANVTLTIQALKVGFLCNRALDETGRIEILKLPYNDDDLRQITDCFGVGSKSLSKILNHPRPRDGNKSSFGRVNLFVGSPKFSGAGVLASRAALRSGAGSLCWVQEGQVTPEWFQIPETLFERWDALPRVIDVKNVWGLGSGSQPGALLEGLVTALHQDTTSRVVLDAEALRALKKLKLRAHTNWVLTPHPKEMAQLLDLSVDQVQGDRLGAVRLAQARFGGVVVLKGYKTIIACQKNTFVSLRGRSGLAKAGAGDVLTGLLCGLLAQNYVAEQAAVAGVLIHALAGDLWAQGRALRSLTPTDLTEMIPKVFSTYSPNRE